MPPCRFSSRPAGREPRLLQWHRRERKLVFIAGQVGWTGEGEWKARDFAGQFRQALANILAVLAQANGRPEHIVRLTWYVLDKHEYLSSLKAVGDAYREPAAGTTRRWRWCR